MRPALSLLALLAGAAAATAAAQTGDPGTRGEAIQQLRLASASNASTTTAAAAGLTTLSPPQPRAAVAQPVPSSRLSPYQSQQAAALGLVDPASAAAFFGVDPPAPPPAPRRNATTTAAIAAAALPPDPSLDDPTPPPVAPALPCTLTVSADLPPAGAAIPACSPVTVYASVNVVGGLPAGAPPLDGFITFSTDGIAATAPLRLVSSAADRSSATASAVVTRWRAHPIGKDDTPGGAALTAWYAPAGGNSSACVSGSSAPLAVPVKRATPVVSVSPSPATLAKSANSTCSLADLHARVNVGAAGEVTDCATPTGLVTLHVVRGDVATTPLHAANLLPAISNAAQAKVAQVAAAEVTAAALKASRAAAVTGSWKSAAAAGVGGAKQEAVLLALDGVAGLAGKGAAKEAAQAAAAQATGATPAQAEHTADVLVSTNQGVGGVGGPAGLFDRARTLLPPLPAGNVLGGLFGRRRLLGPVKEALDSASLIHRKVGAGVLMPTQLLPGMPGHARILPAGDKIGLRLLPGRDYTLVAQYAGDDNFEKASGGGALVVDETCPLV